MNNSPDKIHICDDSCIRAKRIEVQRYERRYERVFRLRLTHKQTSPRKRRKERKLHRQNVKAGR